MTTTRDYTVTGMSCNHCVDSVLGEVSRLAGVDHVNVELASGRLTITGDAFSDDEVREAVHHAGYALADA